MEKNLKLDPVGHLPLLCRDAEFFHTTDILSTVNRARVDKCLIVSLSVVVFVKLRVTLTSNSTIPRRLPGRRPSLVKQQRIVEQFVRAEGLRQSW